MENGVEITNGEHPTKEMDLAVGDGDLKLESVNGVEKESIAESNGSVRDAEENDVFVEAAAEQESFYTPAYQHMASGSRHLPGAVFDAVVSSYGLDSENGDHTFEWNSVGVDNL